MHCLNAFRIRILIIILAIFIFWQIFRNWPGADDYSNGARLAGTPVMVMVFYEALCPDSKHFILKQLEPAFAKASSLIDYQLVPYGKATTNTNRDGSLNFDCQHGPVECEANIYHACTIEAVQDQKVLLDMISCMIANNFRPKEAMMECAKEHRVDYEQIHKCYESLHGAELLKIHGEATAALRPRVSFIPTITLDGAQGRQASILKDLLAEVCKIVAGHGPMPAPCL